MATLPDIPSTTLYSRERSGLGQRIQARVKSAEHLFSHRVGVYISIALLSVFTLYTFSVRQTVAVMANEKQVVERTLESNLASLNELLARYEVDMDEQIGEYYRIKEELKQRDDKIKQLEKKLKALESDEGKSNYMQFEKVYSELNAIEEKVLKLEEGGLLTDGFEQAYASWETLLIERDIPAVLAGIASENKRLDDLANQVEAFRSASGRAKYEQGQAKTDVGTFDYQLVKAPLNGTRVMTLSAADDNCRTDCGTKSVGEFVQSVEGFAGITGGYFCPPAYGICNEQKNFTFSTVYESTQGRWYDWIKRLWNHQSAIVFSRNKPTFYANAAEVPLDDLDAAIVNYPGLVFNGGVMANAGNTDRKQQLKATRAAIGFDGEWIYLVVIRNASVIDSAHVMKTLGAQNALTLDGGGSTALYQDGGYKVGPGRSLPNAIVLK